MSFSKHLWPLHRAWSTSTTNMEMRRGSGTNRSIMDVFITLAACAFYYCKNSSTRSIFGVFFQNSASTWIKNMWKSLKLLFHKFGRVQKDRKLSMCLQRLVAFQSACIETYNLWNMDTVQMHWNSKIYVACVQDTHSQTVLAWKRREQVATLGYAPDLDGYL